MILPVFTVPDRYLWHSFWLLMQNVYFCYAMFRRLIILLLTVLLSYACSCGPKKQHKEILTETVSKEQVVTEDFNKIGEKLQEFLSTGKPLKGWPFKEWGWRLVDNQMVFKMPNGIRITGEVLKEFLSLDHVNHYDSHLGKSRGEWVEMLIHSNEVYEYCGTLDVSDSLNCFVYTIVNEEQVGYHDAFALLVKNGSVTDKIQLACEGYGMWDSIESNRISRNTIVISSAAVDIVDEDGNNPETYHTIRINDDGSTSWSNASKSDFNKPTWNK